jgi:hypothetical protein
MAAAAAAAKVVKPLRQWIDCTACTACVASHKAGTCSTIKCRNCDGSGKTYVGLESDSVDVSRDDDEPWVEEGPCKECNATGRIAVPCLDCKECETKFDADFRQFFATPLYKRVNSAQERWLKFCDAAGQAQMEKENPDTTVDPVAEAI